MDVSFTNVLEGARQYFQGLPATSGSTESPSCLPSHQQIQHNNSDQNHDRKQSSNVPYWPVQEPQAKPPTRERTPAEAQRPPSHHSDPSNSASHNQVISQHESSRVPTNYHTGYQDHSQMFQFQRPQSREIQNNSSQNQYQSHILPNPSYHQAASPKQPRTPTRQEPQSQSPSYHQLQPPNYPSQPYSNYQQRPSYYTSPSMTKSSVLPVNSFNKASHGQPHDNTYAKTFSQYSHNNQQTHSHYSAENSPVAYNREVNKKQIIGQNASQSQSASLSHKTTHNLPPIAALSPVNYLTSRSSRDATKIPSQKQRNVSVTNTQNVQQRPIIASTTPVHTTTRVLQQYPIANNLEFRNGTQVYASSTSGTTSYTYSNTTSSNIYSSHCHESSIQRQNYQRSDKILHTDSNRNQSSVSIPHSNDSVNSTNHSVSANSTLNLTACNQSIINKQKRESPLDLSVKTVRTPADSTLDDVDDSQRNIKYYTNSRYISQPTSQAPSHGYPTYEVYPNQFQKNLVQKTNTIPTVGAPKVDFLPNFNAPSINQPQQGALSDARKINQSPQGRTVYDNKHINQTVYPQNCSRLPHNSIHTSSTLGPYDSNKVLPVKKDLDGMPRMEFPSPGHGHKTTAMYPVNNSNEISRKRPADTAPSIIQNKMVKVDSWKHLDAIDQQIEQKLSSYVKSRMQHDQKQSSSNKQFVNGSYISTNLERPKEIYTNSVHRTQYSLASQQNSFISSNQYQQHKGTHSQTYIPSAAQDYPGYSSYPSAHQPQYTAQQTNVIRTNSTLPLTGNNSNRGIIGGAADKRVLSLLRNSLEIKGAKEAQRKMEQSQNKINDMNRPSRPIVQQPTTDVTAPLQPKTSFIGRNNVSPFTAASLIDRNSNTSPSYKFHVPKAIDSVRLEEDIKSIIPQIETQDTETNSSADLDGLAAFLAARIRTKAELKQVGSSQNSSNNNTANIMPLVNSIDTELIEAPDNNEVEITSKLHTSNISSTSSPKHMKDRPTAYSPRRRLFSRAEEDGNQVSDIYQLKSLNVPLRDKSGLRSSSETSVFDFPDSDSDTEMQVHQQQSLDDMRRDRKCVPKLENKADVKEEQLASTPPSPGDNVFNLACDNFLEQLKRGCGKKRVRRKAEIDSLVTLEETVIKENPLEASVSVKCENIDPIIKTEHNDGELKPIKFDPSKITIKVEKEDVKDYDDPLTDENNFNQLGEFAKQIKEDLIDDSDSDAPLSKVKTVNNTYQSDREEGLIKVEKPGARVKIESTSESSSDSDMESAKRMADKVKNNQVQYNQVQEFPKLPTSIYGKPGKKPTFGDGTDFHPGWEEELYKYKRALRMPATLIHVTRPPNCQRLSTSLPDLDPCPMSPAPSSAVENSEYSKRKTKVKTEVLDSDIDSNSSIIFSFTKTNYDSEEGGSVKSLNIDDKSKLLKSKRVKMQEDGKRKECNILDKLLERYGGRKRKKIKKKDEPIGPKIIPKSENPIELLPTPSLQVNDHFNKSESIVKSESVLLGFRKKTLDNFKDAFINTPNNIVDVNAQFTTVVLKSRTRTETRVLKQKATIREVFGEDRPASAPPVTCIDDFKQKEKDTKPSLEDLIEREKDKETSKKELGRKYLSRGRKSSTFLKALATRAIKAEYVDDVASKDVDTKSETDIKSEIDTKSETPSLDGDDTGIPSKKKNKLRRKFSSGFDYIRKKKKHIKKENIDNTDSTTPKLRGRGRGFVSKTNLESVQDIQKEIKTWVLNKGVGETHLHRAARLGYTDITAYCLEKMDCIPSPKDNAGYTPLHEACSRGHLDIAKLLLMYGANVSESAQGGIRPLHEAVENGFVEIVRLLLSYGADPLLATYTGLTPLSLAVDDITASLLQFHIEDIQGNSTLPWTFLGPASFFDIEDSGYDPLYDVPQEDSHLNYGEEGVVEFEVSEIPLPNLYSFKNDPFAERWILLQDLSNFLKIKSREALLKQINPPTSSSAIMNKQVIREFKMTEFLEQAHCCQFLNANEKLNTRASKIALVQYTDRIRQLLNVEKFVISER